jgi:hypothetical protein
VLGPTTILDGLDLRVDSNIFHIFKPIKALHHHLLVMVMEIPRMECIIRHRTKGVR